MLLMLFFGGGTSIFGTHHITLPENIPEGFRCPSLVLGCFWARQTHSKGESGCMYAWRPYLCSISLSWFIGSVGLCACRFSAVTGKKSSRHGTQPQDSRHTKYGHGPRTSRATPIHVLLKEGLQPYFTGHFLHLTSEETASVVTTLGDPSASMCKANEEWVWVPRACFQIWLGFPFLRWAGRVWLLVVGLLNK